MIMEIADNLIHVVILDISGVYAQIHNDGYFNKMSLDEIERQYSDETRWKIVII